MDDDLKAKQAELERLEREEEELRAKVEKPESKFKASGFKSSFKPIGDVTSTPAKVQQATPAIDLDLDGEEMEDMDVDGEPLANDDSLDGEAMSDIDGEAIDDDVDGEAM